MCEREVGSSPAQSTSLLTHHQDEGVDASGIAHEGHIADEDDIESCGGDEQASRGADATLRMAHPEGCPGQDKQHSHWECKATYDSIGVSAHGQNKYGVSLLRWGEENASVGGAALEVPLAIHVEVPGAVEGHHVDNAVLQKRHVEEVLCVTHASIADGDVYRRGRGQGHDDMDSAVSKTYFARQTGTPGN